MTPLSFCNNAVKCAALVIYTLVFVSISSFASAQSTAQSRDGQIADLIRTCAEEVVLYAQYEMGRRKVSQAQMVEELLTLFNEGLDLNMARVTARQDVERSILSHFGPNPRHYDSLLRLCLADRQLAISRLAIAPPPPSAASVRGDSAPIRMSIDQLQKCLVLETTKTSPNLATAYVKNNCSESITAIWCITEINCASGAVTTLLRPGFKAEIRELQQGKGNNVEMAACRADQKAVLTKLPALGSIRCDPR